MVLKKLMDSNSTKNFFSWSREFNPIKCPTAFAIKIEPNGIIYKFVISYKSDQYIISSQQIQENI